MVTINKTYLSILAIIGFFVLGFFLINHSSQNPRLEDTNNNYVIDYVIKYVKIGGVEVKVDLANTPETRAQGLSGRLPLGEGAGMLFVFEKPDKYAFWMKDMNFAIDIIWLSEDLRIVYIKKDARPELYPEAYGPDIDARYVLEVPAGFSEKYNLKTGDRVEFEY